MIIDKLQRIAGQIRAIAKTQHKPYIVILFEVLNWRMIYHAGINFYFEYGLHLKGRKPADYLRDKQFKRIVKMLNTPEYYPILEDKYFFHQILIGQGLRIPRNRFLIDHSSIFNMDTKVFITREEFLQDDLDGFCKLINGFGGKMIYLISLQNRKLSLNGTEMSVPDFIRFLGDKKFLIQERIPQHKDTKMLNPSCLNTFRIITMRVGQTVHLYQVYMKIGINNSFVDNGISGNIMIGIQNDTGKLSEYAYSSGIGELQYKLDKHPQTQIVFKDYQIPFFHESLEMAKSLHVLFQQFFIIGWDIGITPEGPIVLEGNNITTLYPCQVIYGGMKNSFLDYAKAFQNNQ